MHDIDLAVKCSDYIVLVKDGAVQAAGAPEEVVLSGVIGSLYDLTGAGYDELTGAVELSGGEEKDVFVIGRGGSAAPVMRKMAKLGFGVGFGASVGYDVDSHAAKMICSDSVITNIGETLECIFQRIVKTAKKYSVIVDSGFDINTESCILVDAMDDIESFGIPVIRRGRYDTLGELSDMVKQIIDQNKKRS